MRIGILTVYFADYGSFFHATSLYHFLQSQGHECELIHESLRYKVSKMLALSHVFEKISPEFFKKSLGKRITPLNIYMLLKHDLSYYNISPKCKCVKEIEDRYDCIIIGSDELWSSTNKTIRYIPDYFGLGISKPHLSYSTSGITLNFPNNLENQITEGLKSFQSLAVRDSVTADWIEKLTKQKAKVVLDPALLEPYYKCSDRSNASSSDYVIVYGEDFSEQQVKWIQNFAAFRNLKLCSVAWHHSWCNKHFEIHTALELQQIFNDASFCMSSTFHGTIFAIVNNVLFFSFLSKNRGKKVQLLLHDLDLTERIHSTQMDYKADWNLDFEKVEKILAIKRQDSRDYLLNGLNKIERNL